MRGLRERLSRDAGLSLIELLVVTALLGVVGSVVTSGVIRGMQTSAHAQERIHALTDLEVGAHRVTRELRAANPLWADPSGEEVTATVYRSPAGDPSSLTRFRFTYREADGGSELVEERVEYVDETSTSIESHSTTVVAGGLAQDQFTTFRFYDRDGDEMDPDEGDFTADDVSQVSVTLGAELSTGEVVQVETSAAVRNAAGGE